MPRVVSAIANHEYGAAWAEVIQVVVLDALALLIGQRVSAEREARRQAETTREAHLQCRSPVPRPVRLEPGTDPHRRRQRIGGGDERLGPTRLSGAPSPTTTRRPPVRLVDMIGAGAAARVLTRLIVAAACRRGRRGLARRPRSGWSPSPSTSERSGCCSDQPGRCSGPNRLGGACRWCSRTSPPRLADTIRWRRTRPGSSSDRRRSDDTSPRSCTTVQCRHSSTSVGRSMRSNSPSDVTRSDAPPSLSELRPIVEDTVAELRSIAKGLRPSILDDLGLVASINQSLADAGDRQGFETSFGVTGPERRLPPAVELAVFRIAQEAISNVERHAGRGTSLSASIRRRRPAPAGQGRRKSGSSHRVKRRSVASASLGLPGMTERAHLIGSRLVIHSELGRRYHRGHLGPGNDSRPEFRDGRENFCI